MINALDERSSSNENRRLRESPFGSGPAAGQYHRGYTVRRHVFSGHWHSHRRQRARRRAPCGDAAMGETSRKRPTGRSIRRRILRFVVVLALVGALEYSICCRSRLLPFYGVVDDELNFGCVLQPMEIWPEYLDHHTVPSAPPPLDCSTGIDSNWMFSVNGSLHVSADALAAHGSHIVCTVIALTRGKNDLEILRGTPTTYTTKTDRGLAGTALTSDVSEVSCVAAAGGRYANVHSAIVRDASVVLRSVAVSRRLRTDQSYRPNVLVIGVRSISGAAAWQRRLSKTHAYFVDRLQGVVLQGYSVVDGGGGGEGGDRATASSLLLPLFTEWPAAELFAEVRRRHRGDEDDATAPSPVYDLWIWKRLKDRGYVTQHADDDDDVEFEEQPTDHYLRTFYAADRAAAEKGRHVPRHSDGCHGSVPHHVNAIRWIGEFYDVYPSLPKFTFAVLSGYRSTGGCNSTADDCRQRRSPAAAVDDDLERFLAEMYRGGRLDNTVLVVMSNHGAAASIDRRGYRFGMDSAERRRRRLDERRPYFGVRLPPEFIRRRPTALRRLRANARRLTTAFDVYATLLDVIDSNDDKFTVDAGASTTSSRRSPPPPQPQPPPPSSRGIRLFDRISASRTCTDAGVEPRRCRCLRQTLMTSADVAEATRSADEVVERLNALTRRRRDACAELQLKKVQTALRYDDVNTDADDVVVHRFRNGSNVVDDVDEANLRGSQTTTASENVADVVVYRVRFVTSPGNGLYEANVRVTTTTTSTTTATTTGGAAVKKKYFLDEKDIIRLNEYGHQPHCILADEPTLVGYCHCWTEPPTRQPTTVDDKVVWKLGLDADDEDET